MAAFGKQISVYGSLFADIWNTHCFKELPVTTTTSPPSTTELPPVANAYKWTTSFHIPDPYDMDEIQGRPISQQKSVMPFGDGAELVADNKECLEKNNTELCLKNPRFCADGLSFSIWVQIHSDNGTEDNRRTILSTGADDEGHPGVALYEQDHYVHAIISTGEKVWKAKVYHHVPENEWTVIGIRWSNDTDQGLEFFVLNRTHGMVRYTQVFEPETTASQRVLLSGKVMIGCHKDQDNQVYREFMDGVFDEFAFWKRRIEDDQTNLFIGGYKAETWELDEIMKFLAVIDITRPDQVKSIVNDMMISNEMKKEVGAETTTETSVITTTEVNEETTTNQPLNPENLKDTNSTLSIILKLTELKNCPKEVPQEEMDAYLTTGKLLGENISPSRESQATWKAIMKDEEEKEVLEVAERVDDIAFCALEKVPVTEDKPYFTKSVSSDSMVMIASKRKLSDLMEQGYVSLPGKQFLHPDSWTATAQVGISPKVFRDSRCENRTLSMVSSTYKNAIFIHSPRINEVQADPDKPIKIDSVIISFKVKIDDATFDDGTKDSSEPKCGITTLDPYVYVVSASHLNPVPIRTGRNILADGFFTPDINSNVLKRVCAWRNPKLGNTGAWDISACKQTSSDAKITKCMCKEQGTYAVIAFVKEPMVVPEEPYWVTLSKYILYGLSIFCIILYLLVVAFSGDLKDQFHLGGANLAVALLIGSIAMILSDQDFVREDWEFCGAIGSVIHYFYLAAGAWCCAIGHICFKAITAGVISGKLNTYMCMAWGFSLTVLGLVYMFFLHDIGTDPRCFISWENEVKLTLFIPQLALVCGGFFFSCVIFCNISTPALRKDNLIDDYGSFCRGAAYLLLVFGLAWVFGLFAYVRMGITTDFYPAFTIFNSSMGIVLFLLIGIGSNRFRSVLIGQTNKRRAMLKKNAFGLPGMKRFNGKGPTTSISKITPRRSIH